MQLPERVRNNLDTLAVVALLLVAGGLGYYIGSSGQPAKYAAALEQVVALRDAQLEIAQQQVSRQRVEVQNTFNDALRLLDNLVGAVEEREGAPSLTEALDQAKGRLAEWGFTRE
jgi:hypothetical protein